jgi:hypothetical protein
MQAQYSEYTKSRPVFSMYRRFRQFFLLIKITAMLDHTLKLPITAITCLFARVVSMVEVKVCLVLWFELC